MKESTSQIRKIRKSRGWTQNHLAEKVGVVSEHISQIETGKKKASAALMYKISQALGVTMNSLFVDEVNGIETPQPKFRIPVRARVVAGVADEAIECLEEPIGWEWSSEEPRDDCDVIEIFGDSMEPEFIEGDRLVVQRDVEARNGDVVVAEWHPNGDDERLLTVKVYFRRDGMALLVPINKRKYSTKVMDTHWRVCGVVIKHIRRQMRGRYAAAEGDLFG